MEITQRADNIYMYRCISEVYMETLAISMRKQIYESWCWAAIIESVLAHARGLSQMSQCQIANQVLSQTTCCEKQAPSQDCFKAIGLDYGLNKLNLFRKMSAVAGQRTINCIRHEIECRRPVAIRVGKSNLAGHFLLISGIVHTPDGEDAISILDPELGGPAVEVSSKVLFQGKYRDKGPWTHSYFFAESVHI